MDPLNSTTSVSLSSALQLYLERVDCATSLTLHTIDGNEIIKGQLTIIMILCLA